MNNFPALVVNVTRSLRKEKRKDREGAGQTLTFENSSKLKKAREKKKKRRVEEEVSKRTSSTGYANRQEQCQNG